MFFNVEQALADHATLIDYIKVFSVANDLVFMLIFSQILLVHTIALW